MLNLRTARAVGILTMLARKDRLTTKHLAALVFLTRKQLQIATTALRDAGIIKVYYGGSGALCLARPPAKISLYDIVGAMNIWTPGDKEWNYVIFELKSSMKRVSLQNIMDGARTY